MEPSSMFGPIDALSQTQLEFLLLALVLANLATRFLAQRSYVSSYRDAGAEAISRFVPHEVMNGVLALAAFYYATVELHGGIVLSTLVVGMIVADFFEFESRMVEARGDDPLDQPKGALFASLMVLSYAAYQSIFFIIKPIWSSII